MMKKCLAILLTVLATLSSKGQSVFYPDHLGELSMGEVLYQKPKKDSIQFRNTGNKELVIRRVESSCGCLSVRVNPKSGRIPTKVNNRGWIVVEYDGKLLGQFERYVKVYANDQPEPHYIYFRGRVVQQLMGSPEDFPHDLGNVRMSTDRLDFGTIEKGQTVERQLKVFNASMSPYRPAMHHLPDYLTAKATPEVIASERSGIVTITLDSKRLPALGHKSDAFFLAGYSESVQTEGRINTDVILTEDFSHLTADQRRRAPRLSLSADTIVFDEIGKKKKQERIVELTNTGQTDLHIHAIEKEGTLITSLRLPAMVVPAGGSLKMSLFIEKKLLPKNFNERECRLLMLTDDPDHAAIYIHATLK